MNFLIAIHILIALVLIALVMVQDSKGGGALGIGGGSNSILGAGGAQSLYAKMTRWVAALFALTCILLSVMIARENQSVIDATPIVNPPAATTPVESVPTESAPTETAPADAQK